MDISNGNEVNQLRLFSCHLKASQGYEDRRLAEVTVLRDYLNGLDEGTEFLIAGDMNFYTSSEPGYQRFVEDYGSNHGRGEDLAGQAGVGNWHNNALYVPYHTQSTRTTEFGGGASGGLDDRFDFIFGNYGMTDGEGIDYMDNTYWAFGNDTHHFNGNINDGTNTAVSDEVADALYYASDHLPVIADFVSITPLNSETPTSPYVLRLDQSHPNPFATFTMIPYEISSPGLVTVEVYDVSGRLITRILEGARTEGSHVVRWDGRDNTGEHVGNGIYYYTVGNRGLSQSKSMLLLI